MDNSIQSAPTPYALTEGDYQRLIRANYSIQVMTNLLEDNSGCPTTCRQVSSVLEMATDDLERLIKAIEHTYKR